MVKPHRAGQGARRLARLALVPSLLAALLVVPPRAALAAPPREADFRRVGDYFLFLLGAGVGLGLHEGTHVLFDYALDAKPEVTPVSLGPFPFFAIQPTGIKNNQHRYAIAMSGFMMQDLYSELILQLDPRLRGQRRAFQKGLLWFHILLTTGYAITGFAGIGPAQSDVNTMSRALGVPPWAIGLLLIGPAATDAYRYFVPDSRWAPWVSMGGKLSMIGATLTF